MPSKINFRVIHASGQDDNYKASQLNTHSPTTKGWQSSRFCLYPQDIVLQLESRCRLRKIQILSHQFLIATKVELFVGDVADGTPLPAQNARYKRLGYVEMSTNEKTEYKARELKSVHVDAIGQFIKLLIHKNHVNKLNLFNQVGIIAINVIGDELFPKAGERLNDGEDAVNSDRNNYVSPTDDLAFDLYQDPQIAQMIRKLDRKKQEAVLQERYEYAKRLKTAIQDLDQAGKKLGKYEVEKRRAVEEEDYDTAKLKKVQSDEYRLHVYQELRIQDLLENDDAPTIGGYDLAYKDERQPTPVRLAELNVDGESARSQPTHRVDGRGVTSPHWPYDDRPLPAIAKGEQYSTPRSHPEDRLHSTDEAVPVQEYNDTDRSNEPPEPLNAKDQREAAEVIEVFGLSPATAAYSKNWSHREKALAGIYEQMHSLPPNETEKSRQMLHASVTVINRALKDNVFSVFSSALRLKKMILTEYIKKFKTSRSETGDFIEQTTSHVLFRTGDTAQRLRNAAKAYLVEASNFPDVKPMNIYTRECVEPFKPSVPARLALSRVEVLDQLYDMHGLKNSGLTVENMMKFLTEALAHSSGGDVRQASEEVIIKLYRNVGSPIKDHLPPDGEKTRRNILYKQLFVAFDEIDGKHGNKTDKKAQDSKKRDADLKKLKENEDVKGSKTKGSQQSSKQSPKQQQSPTHEKVCIFCDERNEDFTEEGLDVHYWKACPMLTRCPQCKIVVEIIELTKHSLDECEHKATVSRCPRCSEAIPKADFKNHTSAKSCPPAEKDKAHCPLCHENIDSTEESWKRHLMGKTGCSANPRRSTKTGPGKAGPSKLTVPSNNQSRNQAGGVSPSTSRRNNSQSPSRNTSRTPRNVGATGRDK